MISKPKLIWNLTKRAVEKGDLDEFWKRTNALNPNNLTKMLYSESVVRCLRNALKEQTGIYFQMDEVAASLFHIITEKIEFSRPKLKTKKVIAPKAEAIVDKIA